jgi:hypothetical protein
VSSARTVVWITTFYYRKEVNAAACKAAGLVYGNILKYNQSVFIFFAKIAAGIKRIALRKISSKITEGTFFFQKISFHYGITSTLDGKRFGTSACRSPVAADEFSIHQGTRR